MKLNEKEVEHIINILKFVPTKDLYSLVATVTNGLILPETADEAVQIIILHSENPKSLLHRRKITKEVLFKYLHSCNVDAQITLEKHSLVETILELWSSETFLKKYKFSRFPLKRDTSEGDPVTSSGSGVSDVEVNELARKFSEWYYAMFNQHQTGAKESQLSVEHFWQDCSLHLSMVSPSNSMVQEVHEDAASVVRLLGDTKLQHGLYFNPNFSSSGVQGKVEPHGLVLVMICGTLHQTDKCVGIFEQVFGLARDPFSLNNWKIKNTQVRLKSVNTVSSQPVLNEGELTGNLVAVPKENYH